MNRRSLLKYGAALSVGPHALLAGTGTEVKTHSSEEISTAPDMKIQRLAWAGIKIELDGVTLFVDTTFSSEYNDLPIVSETETRHAIITHHHNDHFDPNTLKNILNEKSRFYCFEDTLPWIDARDFKTQPVKLFQPVNVSRWTSDFIAIPVPAVDGFGHPQVSWIIQGGGKKIIHCGDILWHGYWRDIAEAYGPFDIAFMPINAARLNQGRVIDTGIPAVMNPEQAVVASKLLNAKVVCPIHYGRPSANYFEIDEPEKAFLKFAKERNAQVVLLKQGEYLKW